VPLVWVIDSSSVIEIKQVPPALRPQVVHHMDQMVAQGRLVYPPQVLEELKRYAPPRNLMSDPAYAWAKKNDQQGCHPELLLNEAKMILNAHPDLIEPEATGKDPADPYVIALAQKLQLAEQDARIVTNDTRNINKKVSVAAVAGLLGIPSTVLRLFLRGEGFAYEG
jgi:hypothetical protein